MSGIQNFTVIQHAKHSHIQLNEEILFFVADDRKLHSPKRFSDRNPKIDIARSCNKVQGRASRKNLCDLSFTTIPAQNFTMNEMQVYKQLRRCLNSRIDMGYENTSAKENLSYLPG